MSQKSDICHKTMLYCIEASPKLNEIIACGRYCFRDLTKWPKLDRICKAQLNFFQKLIKENNLNPDLIKSEADRLGITHRTYAQFGLKPQFLDLFQQHFILLISKLKIEDKAEHQILLEAWSMLLSFIISRIYLCYATRT
uniref:Globin family profile domain-containing protein n=1 Tax=Panagrolaimus davidi TaxID=227884 RepID=A0A914QIP5_9BILA